MAPHAALFAAFVWLLIIAEMTQSQSNLQDEVISNPVMVDAINTFTNDLYQTTLRAASGNLVISPLSAALLLALTWQGAGGLTAQQIHDALHLPQDPAAVDKGCKQLIDALQSTSSREESQVILKFANKIYAQKGFRLKDIFRKKAYNTFGAEAEELDFANNTENARRIINRWVEQHTAWKIKDLFSEGSPSPSSLLIFVNAIYLKADWLKPFDQAQTKLEPFYLSGNKIIYVPTMHKFTEFLFASMPEWNAAALEMNYQDGSSGLKMLIILPESVSGLPQLESKLRYIDLNNIPFEGRTVNVSLPKFRIEATHQLNDKLQQLGVRDLFTANADLRGVADRGMYVSNAVQKTFIEVNEKGTEAGAASGLDLVYFSLPPPRADFIANHAFLFFVLKDNVIVFMGRVIDPRQT